jgi:ABC-type nitrate/sulfonate/bicarbonate transport system substrate-binding protein
VAGTKGGNRKIRVTYAAVGGGSLPVWTAFESGIMDRNGLDADVFMIRGSNGGAQALYDGEVEFGNFASPACLKISLQGDRDLVFLTGGLNYLVQTLVVQPEITSIEQLKGKRLGQGGNVAVDEFILSSILPPVGLDPAKDLVHVPISNQPNALGKLERKQIDGCLFTPPWLFEAVRRGFKVLVNPMDSLVDYQLGGVVTTKKLVASDPDVIRSMVKSYVEGVYRFKRDPDFVVDILKKYSNIEDRGIALQTHEKYDKIIQKKPYPSIKGLKAALTHLAKDIPEAANVPPERFADLRWLKELDDSGFIDELYASDPADPRTKHD